MFDDVFICDFFFFFLGCPNFGNWTCGKMMQDGAKGLCPIRAEQLTPKPLWKQHWNTAHHKTLFYRFEISELKCIVSSTIVLFQAREEVFHAQLVAMNTQSGPGSQSSDLLDDAELMTDDRELDADLVGKLITL